MTCWYINKTLRNTEQIQLISYESLCNFKLYKNFKTYMKRKNVKESNGNSLKAHEIIHFVLFKPKKDCSFNQLLV